MIPVEQSKRSVFSLFGSGLRLCGSYWLPGNGKQSLFDRFDGTKSLWHDQKSAIIDLCKSAFMPK
jgi:hypothetical protein